jgi:hypothetical protein
VKGWGFETTDHKIISRIQYLPVNDKDFLVLADEKQVYLLNRKGEKRVTPDKQFAMSGNEFIRVKDSELKSAFVSTDTSGHLFTITLMVV